MPYGSGTMSYLYCVSAMFVFVPGSTSIPCAKSGYFSCGL